MSTAREVVRLFDEGKTPPEIASILGVPEELINPFLASRRRLLDNPHIGIVREAFRALADDAPVGDAGRQGGWHGAKNQTAGRTTEGKYRAIPEWRL